MRHRRSAAATKAQTRAYGERVALIASQLRDEIDAPATPAGRPVLVMLMGFPGVGKSHVARLLAARLGAAHVATDQLRSRLFIAATYAPEENVTVFGAADALLDGLLADGHCVVLDATHLRRSYRSAPLATAARRGVPVVPVRVVADDAETLARLAERRVARADGDHSDADERVFRRMREQPFEPPDGDYLEIVNGAALDDEVARILAAVERACASAS